MYLFSDHIDQCVFGLRMINIYSANLRNLRWYVTDVLRILWTNYQINNYDTVMPYTS